MKAKSQKIFLIIIAVLLISPSSFATNGYFFHGNGVKAQGNAGASIAQFQDALTIANNPAGLSWIGDRVDVGVSLFSPERHVEIIGNTAGANGHYDGNARKYFLLPELGLNYQVNDQVAVGFAIYGNGGMNTDYKQNPFAVFGNTGRAGVNLSQVFLSPAVSWQYADHQSIGIAANFLYQTFEAKGLNGFSNYSASGENLSHRGSDLSTGIGARIGWAGHFFDGHLTLGLNYSSKIDADPFEKYKGLFAEVGNFDVPENYGIGVAVKITPKWTLATDIQRINYSKVKSVGNQFNIHNLVAGNVFGTADGPGFGWKDIYVYKLGVSYQAYPNLILRAGYSHNNQPIDKHQTFLNILAPGVIQDHFSLGTTWNVDQHQELSIAYTHALEKEVKGQKSIPASFGGGEANIKMNQHILSLAYGYKF